jgi:DNA repair exonuclease SbcCD ATPase subunit
MKLSKLVVSGFRGFQGECEFDLSGDIVIVSGKNGTGKTSLFDAIEWALLGDIPRMDAVALRTGEDYISNRYAPLPAFVSLGLTGPNVNTTVNRRGVGSSMSRSVEADGKTLTDELTIDWFSSLIGRDGDRIGTAFERMFMLQQDEIKEFLYADTKDRYEFLAELAGLGDLQTLDQQLKAELKRLRDATRERVHRLQSDESRIEALRRERRESEDVIRREADFLASRVDESAARLREVTNGETRDGESFEDLVKRANGRLSTLDQLLESFEEQSSLAASTATRAAELAVDWAVVEALTASVGTVEERYLHLSRDAEQLEEKARGEALRQERREQLASLALDQLGERCPVCDQTYDREHALTHLRQIIADDTHTVELRRLAEDRRQEAAALADELATLRARHADLLANAEQGRTAAATAESAKAEANAAWQDACRLLRLDPSPPGEWNARILRDERDKLKATIQAAESGFASVSQHQSVTRRLRALDRDLAEQEERVALLRAEVQDLQERLGGAERIAQWLGENIVDATATVIRSTTPLVNELYARLDVHPTFRRFDFQSDRRYSAGHIRPWVYDDDREVDGNAAHLLSSAQLNALAVCLFLSLNLAQASAGLQTVMLDDPVQNMDDVNILSLVDVLRALRTKRQVVISTHDDDLAQLLWRKLRPLQEDQRTIWVQLRSWTMSGPDYSVKARAGENLPKPLELVAA